MKWDLDAPTHEPCGRCGGQGSYMSRLGEPGQDTRQIPYSEIRWRPATGPHPCGACGGTGRRERKPTKTGSYRIAAPDPEQELQETIKELANMALDFEKQETPIFLHAEMTPIPATIVNVEETDGQYGPGFKIVMHEEGAPTGSETWAFTGQKVTSRTKLGRWLQAIYGEIPESGSMADLRGRPVFFLTEHYQNDDGDTREKVVMIKARQGDPRPQVVTQHAEAIEVAPF